MKLDARLSQSQLHQIYDEFAYFLSIFVIKTLYLGSKIAQICLLFWTLVLMYVVTLYGRGVNSSSEESGFAADLLI